MFREYPLAHVTWCMSTSGISCKELPTPSDLHVRLILNKGERESHKGARRSQWRITLASTSLSPARLLSDKDRDVFVYAPLLPRLKSEGLGDLVCSGLWQGYVIACHWLVPPANPNTCQSPFSAAYRDTRSHEHQSSSLHSGSVFTEQDCRCQQQ